MWSADISVALDVEGHVQCITNGVIPISDSFDVTPSLSAEDALVIAAANHSDFCAVDLEPELGIMSDFPSGEGRLVWRMFNDVGAPGAR